MGAFPKKGIRQDGGDTPKMRTRHCERSNLFDRDCFVACAPRNDTHSSLMRCHCCFFDRLPLFWNAPDLIKFNFSACSRLLPYSLRNFSKKGGTRKWHLDKEILEKNARNKIRVHQCLPIVEKILEKPK